METRFFPSIGKPVSLLGFGCMRLPLMSKDTQDIDIEQGTAMVERALAQGVNYFDTAWMYHGGKSEPFIGQALAAHPRDSFFLADKLPVWEMKNAEDAHRIFEEQLRRCQVDFFDFYLIHNVNREHYPSIRHWNVYDLLLKKKEEGLIRHLGFSFHDGPALLNDVLSDYTWDFAQIQLNYVDWSDCHAESLYTMLRERDLPVIVMEPVRGGSLAALTPQARALLSKANPNAGPASWAMRFAASLSGVLTVLSGMSAMEQLEDNLNTLRVLSPLTDDERTLLSEVAALYRQAGSIPCTGCRYCMDCPSGVDIPRVFSVYNHYQIVESVPAFLNMYRTLNDSARASACTGCGECVKHCPQQIPIPDRMEDVKACAAKLMQ